MVANENVVELMILQAAEFCLYIGMGVNSAMSMVFVAAQDARWILIIDTFKLHFLNHIGYCTKEHCIWCAFGWFG